MTKTYEVTFLVSLPEDVDGDITDKQVDEWVRFNLHDMGGISLKNPLSDYEMVADRVRSIDEY